jgi:hypothetical protein
VFYLKHTSKLISSVSIAVCFTSVWTRVTYTVYTKRDGYPAVAILFFLPPCPIMHTCASFPDISDGKVRLTCAGANANTSINTERTLQSLYTLSCGILSPAAKSRIFIYRVCFRLKTKAFRGVFTPKWVPCFFYPSYKFVWSLSPAHNYLYSEKVMT